MRKVAAAILLACSTVVADITVYEAADLPEMQGWGRLGTSDADRWLSNGLFTHYVDLGNWAPPPFGETDFYTRPIAQYAGETHFFLEWRVLTDGPRSEIVGTAPAHVSAWGSAAANYHFTIAADQVRFIRDNFLPILYLDLTAGVPHSFRLELHGEDSYQWYIDGQLVDAGVPEGQFPNSDSNLNWGARYFETENTTQWDYIRYGTIPQPASGDFDSSGAVDTNDVYFFLDCLLGPDSAGPGCRWADMNNDLAVNGDDVQLFAAGLLAP